MSDIDEKAKAYLYDQTKESMDSLYAAHSRLESEIERLKMMVVAIITDAGAPMLTGYPIDPNNFCLTMNNRHKHFSLFMDWIKKEDKEFYQQIMFSSAPFITREQGKFAVRYSTKVSQIDLDDWSVWCIKLGIEV